MLYVAIFSLEEKLFDMKIEDKILRQKVLNSPVKPKMEHLATAMNKVHITSIFMSAHVDFLQ